MNMTDLLIALGFSILIFSMLMGLVQWGTEKNVQRVAAEQIYEVSKAAELYAQRYHATLLPQLTPTSGISISVQDLMNDGFLPAAYVNRNVWGQSYGIYFRRIDTTVPDPDGGTKIEHGIRVIVITEGGHQNSNQFRNKTVVGASLFMPSGGAFVASGDIASQPAGSLIGSGWTLPLADIGVPNPGPGHIAVVSNYSANTLSQDFLYRVEVPGNPDLNAMQTELNMSDHAIERIKEMQFIPHTMAEMQNFCANSPLPADAPVRVFLLENNGLYICREGEVQEIQDTGNALMVKDIRIVANGEVISKPTCSPDTNSAPEIYLSPIAIAAQAVDTPPITAFQAFATSLNDTQWRVTIRMQDAKSKDGEWRFPGSDVAMAQAILLCRSPKMESN